MKNLMLILLFCCSLSTLYAQFGIKGGINASNISTSDDNIEDIKSQLGYQFGVLLDIPISETFSITPEILYVQKGAKYQNTGVDVKSEMNYLEIPVTLSFRPKSIPVRIHIGPQFSYLVSTKVIYEDESLGSFSITDTNRNNYEDFELGVAVGASLHINSAFLQLRYSHSLNEYEKDTQIGNLSIEPASKHFNLQLSLGYFF